MAINDTGDLLGEFYHLLDALRFAAESDYYLRRLLGELGWDAAALDALQEGLHPVTNLGENLATVVELLDQLRKQLDTSTGSYEDVVSTLLVIGQVSEAVDELQDGVLGDVQLSPPGVFEETLGRDLRSWLVPAYIQNRFPQFHRLAEPLGILQPGP